MSTKKNVPEESFNLPVESCILEIRNQRVILGTDLATLYGVRTSAFHQAVKRNADRFPSDFVFELTAEEKGRWSQIVTTLPG